MQAKMRADVLQSVRSAFPSGDDGRVPSWGFTRKLGQRFDSSVTHQLQQVAGRVQLRSATQIGQLSPDRMARE